MNLAELDPASLARLSEAERERLAELIEHQYTGEGLADYIRRTRPHEPPPRHLMPIVHAFEEARRTGGVRVCISMPPRAGKSTTIRSGIAWWLAYSPSDLIIYGSYNKDIAARDQGSKTRNEAESNGVILNPAKRANDEWATLQGGGMHSCGIHAGVTGRGATGVVVVDDPYAGFEEGESDIIRQSVWDTFWGDIMSRVEGWASVIVVHTRFHKDDLIGRLERPPHSWRSIAIPAIAGANDVLGRAPGESFWPERRQYTLPELEKIRLGSEHVFAAMFQQNPMGRGKTVFGPPRYYSPGRVDLKGCTAVIGVDPAASEKTGADWSVAALMAIRNPRDVMNVEGYLINVLRRQVEIPTFARELLAFQRANWNAPIAVEAVGAFKALPALLRQHAPSLIVKELATQEELQGDKFLRAQGLAGCWNAGRFYVPDNSPPWLEDYLGVMMRFTGVRGQDANDDDVDATSHGWNFINGGPMPVRRGAVADEGRWR